MSKERLAQAKERRVGGNFVGDGIQMGGAFVIAKGGRIVLDKRQTFYGDDADSATIMAAVRDALGLPPDPHAPTGGAGDAAHVCATPVCSTDACAM